MLSLRIFKPGSVMTLLAFWGSANCSTNHNLSLHSRTTTCDRSFIANVAPVNVSNAKVNEDRACNCSALGGLHYTNKRTEYHLRISLRSTDRLLLFPTLTKLATSYLFLPFETATVERSFSTLNRIACAERTQLFNITASVLHNAHFCWRCSNAFSRLVRKRNGWMVQNCTTYLIGCAWTLQAYSAKLYSLCLKETFPFYILNNSAKMNRFQYCLVYRILSKFHTRNCKLAHLTWIMFPHYLEK